MASAIPESAEAAPYWEGTRSSRLLVPWCTSCDHPHWFPRAVCPHCLGDGIDWRPSRGEGVIHAVTVQHRPGPGRDAADGPYVVALVDLDDGVRMMANIVDGDPDDAVVGRRVALRWVPLSDGRRQVAFALDSP